MKDLTGKKILVVDDEDLLRDILIEDLILHGADAVGARNGTDAFEILKQQDYDAVVTDARMAGGGGLALIKNINEHFKNKRPKVFLCSGYSDITAAEIPELHIAHVFSKPFNRENFIEVISLACSTKTGL